MRRLLYATVWIFVYLFFSLAPLFVLMGGLEGRPGRGFWREFSVGLGFLGMAMIGLQFLLTARFNRVVRPYGIDVVYHFHRQISQIGFAFLVAHMVILTAITPGLLAQFNPMVGPSRLMYGLSSMILLVLVIILSLKRKGLRFNYEPWRLTHGLFATAAVVLAMMHMMGVGYYMNTPEKRYLWFGLMAIWIGMLVYVRIFKPILLLRRPYRVEEVIQERGDTYTMVFRPEGHKGMRFRPGQFAWLTILRSPFSIREHPFSFSSSALQPDRVMLSVKELGDFTSTIKDIQPGTRAYLDGPYGAFTIDYHAAPGYVFIGGGVGITPFMSMLQTLADRNDQRPIWMFYGSRNWETTTFREQIEEMQERLNMKVIFVLEEAHDGWEGETGYLTSQLFARELPVNRHELEYFVCGPNIMMEVVEASLTELGIPAEQIQSERFDLV
jgi:predicted ferric reductase